MADVGGGNLSGHGFDRQLLTQPGAGDLNMDVEQPLSTAPPDPLPVLMRADLAAGDAGDCKRGGGARPAVRTWQSGATMWREFARFEHGLRHGVDADTFSVHETRFNTTYVCPQQQLYRNTPVPEEKLGVEIITRALLLSSVSTVQTKGHNVGRNLPCGGHLRTRLAADLRRTGGRIGGRGEADNQLHW